MALAMNVTVSVSVKHALVGDDPVIEDWQVERVLRLMDWRSILAGKAVARAVESATGAVVGQITVRMAR